MPDLRAVIIGVSGFTGAQFDDLSFAAERGTELAKVLRDDFGYDVTTWFEPGLSSAELGDIVRNALQEAGPNTVLLIHVLTHGRCPDGFNLYALGADAAIDESTGIAHWLSGVQHEPGRPLTLFLLDLCHAGAATRLPWQGRYADGGLRGWVLAACEPEQSAFDGRFTKAVTNVLREVAGRELTADASRAHVPFDTLAQAVRREVIRLQREARSYEQYVTATPIDPSVPLPELPFIRNPAHADVPGSIEEAVLDLAALPAGDDTHGLRHFAERASGCAALSDLLPADGVIGCFSGRERELDDLAQWLRGDGDGDLCVVSGGSGMGKSALIGVLVCATHERLHGPARPLWERAVKRPGALPCLVTVHARGLRLHQIASSVAGQVGIDPSVTPPDVAAAIGRSDGARPVIVIDSLDEAVDVPEITEWLVSLTARRRSDGSPAVRLLVGTRDYPESTPLHDLARESGTYLNLDKVSRRRLEDDLHAYVTRLLRAVEAFRLDGATTGAFAAGLARALADDPGKGHFGEFLVAGLYTRHFLAEFSPETGPEAAGSEGRRVPRTPAAVVDVALNSPSAGPWLHPVLASLAHAFGMGMPATVIARLAATARTDLPAPSLAEIHEALRKGAGYVRQATDSDGITVYRLSHDALAGHLRRPEHDKALFDALLDGLGDRLHRDWGAAEPYVLRHVLDHADLVRETGRLIGDAGFLLRVAPARYLPYVHGDPELATLIRSLPAERHECPVAVSASRRWALALGAMRIGRRDLVDQTVDLPGEPPLAWRPVWTAGSPLPNAPGMPTAAMLGARGQLRFWSWPGTPPKINDKARVRSFALSRWRDRLTVIVGKDDGEITMVGPSSRTVGHLDGPVTALAVFAVNGHVAIACGGEDGTVKIFDQETGRPIGRTDRHERSVTALAVGGKAGGRVLASVHSDGMVRIRAIDTDAATEKWWPEGRARSIAVGCSSDRTVVVVGCADGVIRARDLAARIPIKPLVGHQGAVLGVAVGSRGGRAVVVSGGQDATVRIWDLLLGREHEAARGTLKEPVRSVALRQTGDGLVCLIGGDRAATLIEFPSRRGPATLGVDDRSGGQPAVSVALAPDGPDLSPFTADPQRAPLTAFAIISDEGHQALAVLGAADGTVSAVDLASGEAIHRLPSPSDGHVIVLRPTVVAGRPAVLVRTSSVTRLWNLTGRAAPIPPDPQTPQSAVREGAYAFVHDDLLTVRGEAGGEITVNGTIIGRHDGPVTAVVTTHLGERAVAISGGQDGAVRVWDLAGRRLTDTLAFPGPIADLHVTGGGVLLVGAGGEAFAVAHRDAPESYDR